MPVLYAAVFVVAVCEEWRRGGSSSLISPDYFIDGGMLRQCTAGQGCNFGGIQSSIPGFLNPSGWLHVRAVLEALGLDVDAMHRLILIGNALAAVLVTLSATRLGGRLAGILAATLFVGWILPLSEHAEWVVSRAPVPLLGAIFLAVCVRAVRRPHVATILLAASIAGVMASFYASSATAVPAVAALALGSCGPPAEWFFGTTTMGPWWLSILLGSIELSILAAGIVVAVWPMARSEAKNENPSAVRPGETQPSARR